MRELLLLQFSEVSLKRLNLLSSLFQLVLIVLDLLFEVRLAFVKSAMGLTF